MESETHDAITVLPVRSTPPAEADYAALMNLAAVLVPTGFLPEHIKTPGQACAIILTGREYGMGPMRALRSLQMVKGKVVENADSQLARFKSDGGHAVFTTLDEAQAVLALRHPNGDEHTETFSLDDAKRAGLLSNSNWKNYPKAMLRSRVITAGLKSVGWEGGAGNYDPEEAAAFAPTVTVPAQTDRIVVPASSPRVTLGTLQQPRPTPALRQAEYAGDTDTTDRLRLEDAARQGSPAGVMQYDDTPAMVSPEPVRDPSLAPSDKQVAFYHSLLKSSVFSEGERDAALTFLETATRHTIKERLDWLKHETQSRRMEASPA